MNGAFFGWIIVIRIRTYVTCLRVLPEQVFPRISNACRVRKHRFRQAECTAFTRPSACFVDNRFPTGIWALPNVAHYILEMACIRFRWHEKSRG
jgi:hypothetical protein